MIFDYIAKTFFIKQQTLLGIIQLHTVNLFLVFSFIIYMVTYVFGILCSFPFLKYLFVCPYRPPLTTGNGAVGGYTFKIVVGCCFNSIHKLNIFIQLCSIYILSGAEKPKRSIAVSSTSLVRARSDIQLFFLASSSSESIFVS